MLCMARMGQFFGEAEVGAWPLSPFGFANAFALELVVIDEVADTSAETAQEETGRRCPMPGQEGWLIDDAKADLTLRQNGARPFAASARVKIVAVEKEQHDMGALDPFEERIKPRRVQSPRIIKLVEAAEGGR